jgi:hypothetical protein
MFTFWERWGAALGILAVACWVVAFAVSSDSPSTEDSNSEIISWYTSTSNQNGQIIGFFVFLAGTLCAIGFYAALRERLAASGHSEMGALAFGAGIASSVMGILAVVLFSAPGFVASDTGVADLTPNTVRLTSDIGYLCWVSGGVISAIAIWAASAVAIRTGLLPRWFGWAGVVAGIVVLFSVFFIPIFVLWLWILVAAALLTWRRPAVETRTPTQSM